MSNPNPNCPSRKVLAAYLRGGLTATQAEMIKEHVFACPACAGTVNHFLNFAKKNQTGTVQFARLDDAGKKWLYVAAGFLIAVAIGGGTLFLLRGQGDGPKNDAPTGGAEPVVTEPTPEATATATSPEAVASPSPSATGEAPAPTATATASPTATADSTTDAVPSADAAPTATPSATAVPSPTATEIPAPTATSTPTATPTATASPSATPVP